MALLIEFMLSYWRSSFLPTDVGASVGFFIYLDRLSTAYCASSGVNLSPELEVN